jgi:ABC-type dipeptide/oligopeptide/nickel transport system permease component
MAIYRFILKRIFYGSLVMLGVTTAVFFIFNVLPGDPARLMLGQNATQEQIDLINKDLGRNKPLYIQYLMYLNDLSPISIHDASDPDHYLYFNPKKYTGAELFSVSETKTLVIKYPYLRKSYITKRKVSEIIADKLPTTALLAVSSIVLASILGIIIGIICAVKKNSLFDKSALVFAVLGMAGPSFVVAIIIAMAFGYMWNREFPFPVFWLLIFVVWSVVLSLLTFRKRKLKNPEYDTKTNWQIIGVSIWRGWVWSVITWISVYYLGSFIDLSFLPLYDTYWHLPGTGLKHLGTLYEYDDLGQKHLALKNIILPAFTLGIRPLAIVIQLMRNSLLDVLSQDYIRTAKAKGLGFYTVIFKHALKNAMNPVVTAISGWFAGLMAGAVFVEMIFYWKGIGSEVVDALFKQDLPVLMGCVLVSGLIFVIINILVDIIYGFLDPRVRVE